MSINDVGFTKSERRVSDSNIFLWIAASFADAAVVNSNAFNQFKSIFC